MSSLFSFPNPVNEKAARTVAGGVVLLVLLTVALDLPWLMFPLAYGFVARVFTGPTLSPLGQFATRVAAPRLGTPKHVPGPPKRFAQGIGVAFSVAAIVLHYGFDRPGAAKVALVMLGAAALLEAAFAICLGCIIFAQLMRIGLIPDTVCAECNDIWARA